MHYTGERSALEFITLHGLATEELILLVYYYRLVDACWLERGLVYIQLGNQKLELNEEQGKMFLQGMLRGYQRALRLAEEST